MVITRYDWRINGDLSEWLATEFPGLSIAQFEVNKLEERAARLEGRRAAGRGRVGR